MIASKTEKEFNTYTVDGKKKYLLDRINSLSWDMAIDEVPGMGDDFEELTDFELEYVFANYSRLNLLDFETDYLIRNSNRYVGTVYYVSPLEEFFKYSVKNNIILSEEQLYILIDNANFTVREQYAVEATGIVLTPIMCLASNIANKNVVVNEDIWRKMIFNSDIEYALESFKMDSKLCRNQELAYSILLNKYEKYLIDNDIELKINKKTFKI